MSQDKQEGAEKDSSLPGREEEVVKNDDPKSKENSAAAHITKLPSGHHIPETEGERRFKEGMANNSDTDK